MDVDRRLIRRGWRRRSSGRVAGCRRGATTARRTGSTRAPGRPRGCGQQLVETGRRDRQVQRRGLGAAGRPVRTASGCRAGCGVMNWSRRTPGAGQGRVYGPEREEDRMTTEREGEADFRSAGRERGARRRHGKEFASRSPDDGGGVVDLVFARDPALRARRSTTECGGDRGAPAEGAVASRCGGGRRALRSASASAKPDIAADPLKKSLIGPVAAASSRRRAVDEFDDPIREMRRQHGLDPTSTAERLQLARIMARGHHPLASADEPQAADGRGALPRSAAICWPASTSSVGDLGGRATRCSGASCGSGGARDDPGLVVLVRRRHEATPWHVFAPSSSP